MCRVCLGCRWPPAHGRFWSATLALCKAYVCIVIPKESVEKALAGFQACQACQGFFTTSVRAELRAQRNPRGLFLRQAFGSGLRHASSGKKTKEA